MDNSIFGARAENVIPFRPRTAKVLYASPALSAALLAVAGMSGRRAGLYQIPPLFP